MLGVVDRALQRFGIPVAFCPPALQRRRVRVTSPRTTDWWSPMTRVATVATVSTATTAIPIAMTSPRHRRPEVPVAMGTTSGLLLSTPAWSAFMVPTLLSVAQGHQGRWSYNGPAESHSGASRATCCAEWRRPSPPPRRARRLHRLPMTAARGLVSSTGALPTLFVVRRRRSPVRRSHDTAVELVLRGDERVGQFDCRIDDPGPYCLEYFSPTHRLPRLAGKPAITIGTQPTQPRSRSTQRRRNLRQVRGDLRHGRRGRRTPARREAILLALVHATGSSWCRFGPKAMP